MIKVLRIINRFNLGGPTYNATYLTAYLSEEFETLLIGGGHEAHEGASTFIPEQHGAKFTIIPELQREISFGEDKKALKKLREIIRDYKPDVVHTHASKAGFLGRLAAYKEKVPVIVHTFHGHVFHSYFGATKTRLYKAIERYMAKKSDAIIAISEIQKEELSKEHKIAHERKFRIIPLGFELERFREDLDGRRKTFRDKYELSDEAFAIGIIGRLTDIKNHSLFLRSIEIAAKQCQKKIKVLIIGDGELRESIEREAKEIEKRLGLSIFIFTSWIKNIAEALPGLDLVALSSKNEGTPVSLIEAQAAGVPVITTNVGGVRNVVEHEVTGLVINSFEPSDFAGGILKIVNSQEIHQKMSQNGWNHVKERYHYLRLCKDVENLYFELLKKKGVIK